MLSRWYAVQTRSNCEQRVSVEITRKPALGVFLPCIQIMRRELLVDVPLFRGYLFCQFADTADQRVSVLSISGVSRILGHGMEIEAIPDCEIEALRLLMSSPRPVHADAGLTAGTRVRVKRGPLEGLEGVLIRVKKQHRLVIAIDLLRSGASTEVDVSDVEIIPVPRDARVAHAR